VRVDILANLQFRRKRICPDSALKSCRAPPKPPCGSGRDDVRVLHRPRLLSDNGSSYISGELASWLGDKGMDHTCAAPGDLEQKIADFISHYNHVRYHECIANLTPADVYFCRTQAILKTRERIKRNTLKTRRLHHGKQAA
jgi:putative transposase